MTSTNGPLIASLGDLGVRADKRAHEIEAARRLPDDLAAALRSSDLCRAFVPRHLDGPGCHPQDVFDAIAHLAAHDGATAWVGMIASTTSLIAGYLPPDWAAVIFGPGDAMVAGHAAPMGRAVPVDGGLRVSGSWQWGSGTHHCTYIGGGAVPVDPDDATIGGADGFHGGFVLFEASQVELADDWRASGLRGTGSGDYRVADAFVPTGRWAVLGQAVDDGPMFRFPFYGALALGVCSVAVGLGRRAISEVVELAAGKKYAQSTRRLAERPAVQAGVADAQARVDAGWSFVREAVGEVWARAEAGPVPDEARRRLRLAATHATRSAAQAVDLCYDIGGGSSVHETSALQRVFRDVHVATQHAMIAPRTYEVLGRAQLGLPTDHGQL